MSTPPRTVASRSILVRGLRTHNLKAIDLDLPVPGLIAITGVSGAGKSSLAIDTLYAEGQRRYVETFSPYTRQFLARLDKPDADRIEGIPPAIALSQGVGRQPGRSTVATITEIHDALALVFARAGDVICRNCGRPVAPSSPASVARAIEAWDAGVRYEIAFPVDVLPGTDQGALTRSLRAQGFTRLRVGGLPATLDDVDLKLSDVLAVDVIVDRLIRGKDPIERRTDSIETAFDKGMGRCRIIAGDDAVTYLRGWRCAHCGTDHIEPQPALFRYNSAQGACPLCEGLGQTMELDLARIVPDPSLTIRQGAIAPWATPAYQRFLRSLLDASAAAGIPTDVPFRDLSAEQVERVLNGVAGRPFTGVRAFFRRLERRASALSVRGFLRRWRRYRTCPSCQGARLRAEALAVKVMGHDIATLSRLTIRDACVFVDAMKNGLERRPGAAPLVSRLERRLGYLREIGVDYLTLDRAAATLSAGEARRVGLTKTLGSGLVNTLYVLDEPTLGLHAQDVGKLIAIVKRLRDQRNTVVVVEHDDDVIRAVDHVVDLGPGAGAAGGKVLYSGPVAGLESVEGSATGDFLSGRKRAAAPGPRRPLTHRRVRLSGASGHNLKGVDVVFPLGLLCVVTGVSGAGKSTLVEDTLYPALRHRIAADGDVAASFGELAVDDKIADVVFLDQSPLSRSARSNPATHLGVFDEIRKTFAATHEAKLRNYDAGRFSFNVDGGRCNACQGRGFITIDMQFLPDVLIRCPECLGTRYRPRGFSRSPIAEKNIAEVLDLTAREAFSFFRNRPKIQLRLRPLLDIGLDYLRLGQPVSDALRRRVAAAQTWPDFSHGRPMP